MAEILLIIFLKNTCISINSKNISLKELTKLQEKIDSRTDNSKSKFKIRINMSRSYTDVASSAIFLEVFKIMLGYILMFVYTSTMLGRFNILHQRFYLTFSGIFSVVLGILVSVGWSGILGFPYTPMHAILPFLMIGIGIDNMFVIVQCWYNLNSKVSIKSRYIIDEFT